MLSKEQFAKGFAILARAYPKQEVPKGTAEVYYSALVRRQVTSAEWEAAVNACIDTLKFFPSIAELLEAVPKPSAEEAWARVLGLAMSGRHEDLLTYPEKRALAIFGGLYQFSLTPYADLQRRWRDFKSAYDEAIANPKADHDRQVRIEGGGDQKQIRHEGMDSLAVAIAGKMRM